MSANQKKKLAWKESEGSLCGLCERMNWGDIWDKWGLIRIILNFESWKATQVEFPKKNMDLEMSNFIGLLSNLQISFPSVHLMLYYKLHFIEWLIFFLTCYTLYYRRISVIFTDHLFIVFYSVLPSNVTVSSSVLALWVFLLHIASMDPMLSPVRHIKPK